MTIARWSFYLYFSVSAGLFAAGTTAFVVQGTSSTGLAVLPGNGGLLWLGLSFFIGASLVFGNWAHFGERVGLIRWVALCSMATLLVAAGFMLGFIYLD